MRFLFAFIALCFSTIASAQTVEPGDLRLELQFEERSGPLYVGEMVLLKVRGFYKIRIAREMLMQADLDGFDWMQLGEDTWSKDTSKGHEILQFERTIALFPNRAGTLELKPFKHELELWTRTGERYDKTIASAPISIEVTERPDTEDWWLPVRRITVDDQWSNPPHQLGTGEGALRVVTVTVEGVRLEQIPSMPELGSAGALVFPHPEIRMKRLYKRGPVTRVLWRWTVRPENPPSAYLDPIRLAYFDTKTREHREIVVSAQRIAMTEEAVARYLAEADSESVALLDETQSRDDGANRAMRFAGLAIPLGFLGGLFGGLALMIPGIRRHHVKRFGDLSKPLRPDPDIGALKRAVADRNAPAARRAAMRVLDRGTGDTAAMRNAIAEFDRALFAVPETEPNLSKFKTSMVKAARSKPN